tara:strand:- start:2795 stop:3076 length:282 start_codon:yes stop_codon:yes gene_type:complete
MFKSKKDLDELFGKDEAVAGLVIAICATMYDNGVRVIPIGGLMRLLGVPSVKAKHHDDKAFQLTDNFYEQIEAMGFERIDEASLHLPSKKTLH